MGLILPQWRQARGGRNWKKLNRERRRRRAAGNWLASQYPQTRSRWTTRWCVQG